MYERFLMAVPNQLTPHFLFNPWMRWHQRVDPTHARQQWDHLVGLIHAAGGQVELMELAEEGTGAITFTADGALVYAEGRAILLDNDGPRGVMEPSSFRRWLEGRGYQTEGTPYRLDGGNVVAGGPGVWLIGSKPGSTGRGERYLGRLLTRLVGAQCYRVPLTDDRFLHLDMAFANLGGRAYLYFPGAFGDLGASLLEQPWARGSPFIPVSEADAEQFACNTVTIGETVIIGPVSHRLRDQLKDLGFRVAVANLDEFYKAGGGAKCLTLPLSPPIWGEGEKKYGNPASTGH